MNLYQKGLLAFGAVILIAVVTVAIVAGYSTESAFRRYAELYSGRTQMAAEALIAYYDARGNWTGLQDVLPELTSPGRGRGRGEGASNQTQETISYRVADASRTIVASSVGAPEGKLSTAEAVSALPLTLGDLTVGYLALDPQSSGGTALDEPATAYLTRLRWALALGGGVASIAALLLAGLLTRSIVSPVRTLTQTAEIIAQGHFEARADVGGRDEIARLATTFNQMAAGLERAEDARRAQTADIAHELRNPLAILQSSLEALADRIYEPTPQNIEPALDQVQTLNRLVEDLGTLALADTGQLRLDLQPVDLGRLVTRVVDGYRDTLREKDVSVVLRCEPSKDKDPPSLVLADYTRLTQVLNNVLSNAVRYLPAGCTLKANVSAQDAGVTACFTDNGPGIPEEDLPRLFDRFWRREPSRSRDSGGSGLGLAIAHQIVQAHGGRIWG